MGPPSDISARNRVMADVSKMRVWRGDCLELEWGPKSKDSVYKGRRGRFDTESQRRRLIKPEPETRVMLLQDKEPLELPEAKRSKEGSPLKSSEEAQPNQHLIWDFWLLEL
jgi:hypothetical protein